MARQHRNPGLRRQHFDSLLRLHQGPICQGCYWWFDDYEDLEVDHKNPKSAGGEDTLGNLTLLCSRCNKIKSNRLALPGLQDELKKDPEAMPQSPSGDSTVYVVNGRSFTANLKPTKALRVLLDEVANHSQSVGRDSGFDEAIEKGNAALGALRRSSETIDVPVSAGDNEADIEPTGVKPERLGQDDGTELDAGKPTTPETKIDMPLRGTTNSPDHPGPEVAKHPLTLADITGPVSGRIQAVLTLPDKEVRVNNWTELYVELARYLVRSGKLNRSLVPVKTSRGARYAVTDDGRHSDGKLFQQPRDIGNGLVLETNASATTKLGLSKRLLEECGESPSRVELQMIDQTLGRESGVTSHRPARTNRRKRGVRRVRDSETSGAVTATSDAIGSDGWKRLAEVEGDWHMAPPSRFKLAGRPVVEETEKQNGEHPNGDDDDRVWHELSRNLPTDKRPTLIRFGGRRTQELASWRNMYVTVAAHLVKVGKINESNTPLKSKNGKPLLVYSTTDRPSFNSPANLGKGFWLEANSNIQGYIRLSCRLLSEANGSPASVEVCFD